MLEQNVLGGGGLSAIPRAFHGGAAGRFHSHVSAEQGLILDDGLDEIDDEIFGTCSFGEKIEFRVAARVGAQFFTDRGDEGRLVAIREPPYESDALDPRVALFDANGVDIVLKITPGNRSTGIEQCPYAIQGIRIGLHTLLDRRARFERSLLKVHRLVALDVVICPVPGQTGHQEGDAQHQIGAAAARENVADLPVAFERFYIFCVRRHESSGCADPIALYYSFCAP